MAERQKTSNGASPMSGVGFALGGNDWFGSMLGKWLDQAAAPIITQLRETLFKKFAGPCPSSFATNLAKRDIELEPDIMEDVWLAFVETVGEQVHAGNK